MDSMGIIWFLLEIETGENINLIPCMVWLERLDLKFEGGGEVRGWGFIWETAGRKPPQEERGLMGSSQG